jgi:hypothetical protein
VTTVKYLTTHYSVALKNLPWQIFRCANKYRFRLLGLQNIPFALAKSHLNSISAAFDRRFHLGFRLRNRIARLSKQTVKIKLVRPLIRRKELVTELANPLGVA